MLRKRKHRAGGFNAFRIIGNYECLIPDQLLTELVSYLNRPSPAAKVLIELIKNMQDLEKMKPPAFDEQIEGAMIVYRNGFFQPNPALKKIAPEKYKRQLEIDRTTNWINDKLAEYKYSPQIFSRHDGSWNLVWSPKGIGPSRKLGQAQFLEMILTIVRAGYLDKFRCCGNCKKWLYAKLRNQTFCSTKCRQKEYTQTDEFKMKRRVYMRRYYHQNYSVKHSRYR